MIEFKIADLALNKILESITKKLRDDKEGLLAAIEACINQSIKEKVSQLESLKKDLQELQWFLGEERARRENLELQLKEKNEYVHKMEEYSQRLKGQNDEAMGSLQEEKTKKEQAECALKGLADRSGWLESELGTVKEKLAQIEKEYRDTQWYLGEERARREGLENQLKEIQEKQ
jgi:chromosome segregation ATPase